MICYKICFRPTNMWLLCRRIVVEVLNLASHMVTLMYIKKRPCLKQNVNVLRSAILSILSFSYNSRATCCTKVYFLEKYSLI